MLKPTAIVTVAAFASSGAGLAAEPSKQERPREYISDRISAEIAIGAMTGQANELVYNQSGGVISKLIWKYDGTVALSGGISMRPFDRFTLGMRGRINLTGDSAMDDFDYPGSACGITGPLCHSQHPDTRLERATSVDLFAAFSVYQAWRFSLSGVVGYRWNHAAWDARGGTSNYAPPFPNMSVITYEQRWQAPYLGVEAATTLDRFSFGVRIAGSALADGRGKDDHRLRSLLFADDFNSSGFVSTQVKFGYEMFRDASVTLAWDYDRWLTAKGPTVIHNYATGTTVSLPGDAAGANSETNTISMGLQIKY